MTYRLHFLSVLIVIGLLQVYAQDTHANTTFKNYDLPSAQQDTIFLHAYSYQQTTGYTCGPAVIMSLLHYYGMLNTSQMNHQTEMRIAKEMGTTLEDGTSLESMASWLKNHGFDVNYGQGVTVDMLVDNLKRGIPTIIIWNDWTGHALLVVGYQIKQDMMLVDDPSTTSSVTDNQTKMLGVNAISENELQSDWFNARYVFNPSHTAIGMYIIAVPNGRH